MASQPFLRSFAPSLSLLALTLCASAAHAQGVNDADRAAARELYVQGVELQEAGKFADALDRFTRAQSVFSAPTHLLHIAECDAALGKLVESAETYRTLVRTPLPDGAPNAFVQAQKQGAAELTQVEPRLPSIRLVVRPENTQNLSIQIDGQPMSSALVGVQRPTDPGPHTIVVYAPGFAKAQQRIALQEKENRDVAFTLQPTSGIVYGTAPVYAPPVQPAQPAPQYAPQPAPQYPPAPPPYGAPPPRYGAPYAAPPEYQAPSDRRPATGGFMMGPSLGLMFPGGQYAQSTGGEDTSMRALAGTGAGLGVEAGFRFARRLYLGFVYDHAFLSGGNASPSDGLGSLTSTANANEYRLNFAYISHPDGVAFYGEIGAGFRTLSSTQTQNGGTSPGATQSTYSGGELSIGGGVHVKIGDWIRLIPKVNVAGGQFGSVSCTSTGAATCAINGSIGNQESHTFVFVGVTGFIDFARKP